jgi:hypothetical protein
MVKAGTPVAVEPSATDAMSIQGMPLKQDQATMDDCNNIWKLLGPTVQPVQPPPNNSLTIGYLIIQSLFELDVDAIYTAEVNAKPAAGVAGLGDATGISIDVERVVGKKI